MFYRHDITKAVKEADAKPGDGWERISQGGEPIVDESADADAALKAEAQAEKAKPSK